MKSDFTIKKCFFHCKKDNIDELSFGLIVFEIPRGTRDFSPIQMNHRRFVENKLRFVFESYGYDEIQTPTFEHLDLFTEKSGEQILDELYSFTDKGGRNLALRPELTAPVIRFYVNKLQMEPKPLKLFYFGNCFRYDRPQKGRYREFMQAGCELIGTSKPEAIAELISLASSLIYSVGLHNINLHIGDLSLLKQVFLSFSISDDIQSKVIPAIDKEEFDEVELILANEGVTSDKIISFLNIIQSRNLNEIKRVLANDSKAQEIIDRLDQVLSFLSDAFQLSDVILNLGIVRGLDYYTGIVFEIEAPALGAEKQICGGGEYSLIDLFGGRDTPTAGFALGFDRTILAMQQEKIDFPGGFLDFFIIPVDNDLLKDAISIAQCLRNMQYMVDIDLKRRGIGKALKYASNRNAKKVLLLGSDEKEQHAVTLRDMRSGEQKMVKLQHLFKEKEQ